MDTFEVCDVCAEELKKKFLRIEDENLKNGLCQMCWLNFGTFLERQELLIEVELNKQALIEFKEGNKENNIPLFRGILKSIKNFFEKIYFDFLSKLRL